MSAVEKYREMVKSVRSEGFSPSVVMLRELYGEAGEVVYDLQGDTDQLRSALIEAREALATLDHMNGKDSGLAVIRGGKPIQRIIDDALNGKRALDK